MDAPYAQNSHGGASRPLYNVQIAKLQPRHVLGVGCIHDAPYEILAQM